MREGKNATVSGTKTHLAAFLALYLFERRSRKRVKSAKSLWGEEELLSQFVSSPIHVLLCSLSSFSPLQSVSNKLFSLFLSLHWLLRCLFSTAPSTTACCLFGRLARGCCVLCVPCMCICSRAPQGPGGVTLSVKWPSTLPTYLSQDEAAASQWKIPIPERWARRGKD